MENMLIAFNININDTYIKEAEKSRVFVWLTSYKPASSSTCLVFTAIIKQKNV